MNELTLDGKTYVSSKRAAEITGYAKDYVGQLCREGHVEARLVGRNWYVLESSIRDHRYGKKVEGRAEEAAPATINPSTWSAPRYTTETPAYIAPVASKKALEESEIGSKEALLTDMHAAWQEWFDHGRAAREAEPEIEIETEREEAQEVETEDREPEIDSGEQPVTIYRSEEAHNFRQAEPEQAQEEREEAFVVEERIMPRPISGIKSLAIQSLLAAVCLIAIAVTAIGTGLAGKFTDIGAYRLSAISYLAGTSAINKQ